ncbi:MAG: hypothetical protein DCC73_04145 [Proteobacteria bacterium]|jgi:hypothetical protein|nr:MAG: hypothetical protein DCC73_04145 [Pseudomonadota bacterium]
MSVHMAYEVRVLRGAGWRVEGIFDDETIAVAAAKKVEGRADRSPVVVIQEVYDAARNHLKSRSIYRSGGDLSAHSTSMVLPFPKAAAPRPSAIYKPTRRPPRAASSKTSAEIWPWLALLIGGFVMIVFLLMYI